MAGQRGEQSVLRRGQDDGRTVDRHLLVGKVDVQGAVVEGRHRLTLRDLAPSDGLQAGQQLDAAERLGEVVVGAGIESPHLVSLGPEGREHEDRHVAHVPDALQDLPPVQVGEPDVENDDVGVALVELTNAVTPLDGLRDRIALAFEEGSEELPDVRLILNDQH